jgi:hypothetical protein
LVVPNDCDPRTRKCEAPGYPSPWTVETAHVLDSKWVVIGCNTLGGIRHGRERRVGVGNANIRWL